MTNKSDPRLATRLTVLAANEPTERVGAQVEFGPVWLLDTADNRRLANRLWGTSRYPDGHITVFDDKDDLTGLIQTISEHHPYWTMIAFFGVTGKELEATNLGRVEFDADENIASMHRKAEPNA